MVNRSFADMRRTPVSPASCRALFALCALRSCSSSLLAADYHRTVLDVCAEDSAQGPPRSPALVYVLRDDVVAICAACLACLPVALAPAFAGIAAAAVDGEARFAARQVGELRRRRAAGEARKRQGSQSGRHGRCAFHRRFPFCGPGWLPGPESYLKWIASSWTGFPASNAAEPERPARRRGPGNPGSARRQCARWID